MQGFPSRCSIMRIPGQSSEISPRNLLMTKPAMRSRSSWSSSSQVPSKEAKTPPRSMSPTSKHFASAILAMRMFTMSFSFRLISAGEPAPSRTMTSFCSARMR